MESLTTIRPELLVLSEDQLRVLLPYGILFFGSLLAIMGCILKKLDPKWPVFLITLISLGAALYSSAQLLNQDSVLLFNGMMVADSFSHFFNMIFLIAAIGTVLVSLRYLDKEGIQHPEYYVLVLFAVLGMMLLACSLDLIVLFVALELMSLAVYVLVGFRRADRKSNEAAMKYFILGSAASAVFLYGVALLYGSSASTHIRQIFQVVQAHPEAMSPTFYLGAGMVMGGFLFKVAAVPFHAWMPDVYEGSPTPITGFMTTGLKAAAFAAFFRVFASLGFGHGLSSLFDRHIHDILWLAAILTMVLGNVVALTQVNLKRMLAYSSIAHTGYILVGLVAASNTSLGFGPGVMYLVSYCLMNLGAFAVLSVLAGRNDSQLNLGDLSGLSQRHPWLSLSMAVFVFSMAGIPPTAGFVAKYFVFYSAIQAGETTLVIVGVLTSAVSAYYYLRILVYMYMRDPLGSPTGMRVPIGVALVVMGTVFMTLNVGLMPEALMNVAQRVASHF